MFLFWTTGSDLSLLLQMRYGRDFKRRANGFLFSAMPEVDPIQPILVLAEIL